MKKLTLIDFLNGFISFDQEVKVYEWDDLHEEDEVIFTGTPDDIAEEDLWPLHYVIDYVHPNGKDLEIYVSYER